MMDFRANFTTFCSASSLAPCQRHVKVETVWRDLRSKDIFGVNNEKKDFSMFKNRASSSERYFLLRVFANEYEFNPRQKDSGECGLTRFIYWNRKIFFPYYFDNSFLSRFSLLFIIIVNTAHGKKLLFSPRHNYVSESQGRFRLQSKRLNAQLARHPSHFTSPKRARGVVWWERTPTRVHSQWRK